MINDAGGLGGHKVPSSIPRVDAVYAFVYLSAFQNGGNIVLRQFFSILIKVLYLNGRFSSLLPSIPQLYQYNDINIVQGSASQ